MSNTGSSSSYYQYTYNVASYAPPPTPDHVVPVYTPSVQYVPPANPVPQTPNAQKN